MQLESTWKGENKALLHFTQDFFFFLQSSSYVKIMLDLLINFRKYRSSSQKEFHKYEQAKHGNRSCTDSLILMRLQDQTGPLVLVKTRAGPSDRKGT